MNDLLFTALILALLYYFFYYLPQKKHLESQFTQQNISTQTDPFIDQKVNQELTELKAKEKNYQTQLKTKDQQITKLQTEIRELAKRPLKPTNSKGTQTIIPDNLELTNTLDTLIKNIQELNNSLC